MEEKATQKMVDEVRKEELISDIWGYLKTHGIPDDIIMGAVQRLSRNLDMLMK